MLPSKTRKIITMQWQFCRVISNTNRGSRKLSNYLISFSLTQRTTYHPKIIKKMFKVENFSPLIFPPSKIHLKSYNMTFKINLTFGKP